MALLLTVAEMEGAEQECAIVFDLGSYSIKSGISGEDSPQIEFPSTVGRKKWTSLFLEENPRSYYVGESQQRLRSILDLRYPIKSGQKLIEHAGTRLGAHYEEHPVLMNHPSSNHLVHCDNCTQILFETFNCPAIDIVPSAHLNIYACGITTGLVVNVGEGVTFCSAIYEGYEFPHRTMRQDYAGRDVTEHLQLLLNNGGYSFTSQADFEILREIKEATCFVKQDAHNVVDLSQKNQYTLSDGHTLHLGSECWLAPEILFRPVVDGKDLLGVPDLIWRTLQSWDIDSRSDLSSAIFVVGGTTLLSGFVDRLETELCNLKPVNSKLRVVPVKERVHNTWIGGSILSSLSTHYSMWLSREEYDEGGCRRGRVCF